MNNFDLITWIFCGSVTNPNLNYYGGWGYTGVNARLALVCGILCASGCTQAQSPPPAVVVRTAVDSAELACKLYRNDARIPRDPAVTEFCGRMGCEK